MSYREYAIREFEYAGWLKDGKYDDDMQEMMCNQVLELLDLFAEHGHSGSSAPYAINLFTKLAKFEPIVPIQGTDEWTVVENDMFQHKRLSSVFKHGELGTPYYIEAIIWKDERGICFTGSVEGIKSRQSISFPFLPKRIYIDVIKKDGDYVIKDREQLEEVKKYYIYD